MLDIPAIKRALHEGIILVNFKKKNGEIRNLHCTTNLNFIPSQDHPKGTGYASPATVQRCYDIEICEWRSFRWDSVNFVKIGK